MKAPCGAEGCPNQARPKGRFCSDACRSRDWKARTKYQRPEPTASSGNGRERRSGGLQLSYRRAVEELARELWFTYTRMSKPACRVAAEGILSKALPARQRARLEARR